MFILYRVFKKLYIIFTDNLEASVFRTQSLRNYTFFLEKKHYREMIRPGTVRGAAAREKT